MHKAVRFVQLTGPAGRCVALVEEPRLVLLDGCSSVYELAQRCIAQGRCAGELAPALAGRDALDYEEVYSRRSEWRLLPSADHPQEPARCMVSGTGLTHMASARNRQAMHGKSEDLTDSMRMYAVGR